MERAATALPKLPRPHVALVISKLMLVASYRKIRNVDHVASQSTEVFASEYSVPLLNIAVEGRGLSANVEMLKQENGSRRTVG